jgi:hypothetical protein
LSHSSRSLVDPIRCLAHSSIISQIYLLLQYRGNCIDCSNRVCTVHIIRSALTTTAAIVVLGDWFPAFVASPFQLRFEEV